jgi:hypothetical protein
MKGISRTLGQLLLMVTLLMGESQAQLVMKGQWIMDTQEGDAVTVSGNYAYVVLSMPYLRVIDISDPTKPAQVGEAFLQAAIDTRDVAVWGDYAYVAAPSPGPGGAEAPDVFIVSVANKANPQKVGAFAVDGAATTLTAADGRLYVGTSGGLAVYSLSNPTTPQLLGSYGGVDVRKIAVANDLAYIAAGTQGIVILDVSAPSAVSRVGGTILGASDEVVDLALVGNYVEVAANTSGGMYLPVGRLRIVDVSNPTAPVEVYEGFPPEQGKMNSIEHIGSLTVIGGAALHVFDTSNPTAPVKRSSLPLRLGVKQVESVNGRALVLNRTGLTVVDVADPAKPSAAAVHPMAIRLVDIASRGGYLYAPDLYTGLVIFDVTDPAAPKRAATIDIPAGTPAIEGDRLYLANTDGFTIYSLADPLRPVRLGGYTTRFVIGFDVRNNLVFLGGAEHYAFQVVDATDPAAPKLVANYSPNAQTAGGGVELVGNHVLLTAVSAAILYDATDPTNIQYVGPVAGSTDDFASDGLHFFVSSDRLYAYDLGNEPTVPKDSLDLFAGKIAASEGRLVHGWPYTEPRFELIDARDVSDIKIVDQKAFPASAIDLTGSRLYTAGSGTFGYTLGRTTLAVWDAMLPELPSKPAISTTIANGQVVLRWPDQFGAFRLYSTSELNTTWQLVTSSAVHEGNTYVYTNRFPLASAQFYKLAQ